MDHAGIAGEVNQHRRHLRQLLDILIGQHFAIEAPAPHEIDIVGRGQPDPSDPRRLVARDAGQRHRGLGRSAGADQRVSPEPAFAAHEAFDQEPGLEQRPEDHPLTLARRIVLGIGGQAAVLVVDRAHRLAVRGHIGEAAGRNLAGQHIEALGHRQIAIDPFTHRDLGMAAFHHHRMPPHRHHAPIALAREEVPVAEGIARHRVGDVVGSDREALDLQPHLAIAQRRQGCIDYAGFGNRVAFDLDCAAHRNVSQNERAPRQGAPIRNNASVGPIRPASASARRAPGSCRPCGSGSARRHRRGGVPPYRHRSGQGCP